MYFWIATGLFAALVVFLSIRDIRKPDNYCEDCMHILEDSTSDIEFSKCKLRRKREYVAREVKSYEYCCSSRVGRKCRFFNPKNVDKTD